MGFQVVPAVGAVLAGLEQVLGALSVEYMTAGQSLDNLIYVSGWVT